MLSLNIDFLLIDQRVGAREEDQILRDQIKKLDFSLTFSYGTICQPGLFIHTHPQTNATSISKMGLVEVCPGN